MKQPKFANRFARVSTVSSSQTFLYISPQISRWLIRLLVCSSESRCKENIYFRNSRRTNEYAHTNTMCAHTQTSLRNASHPYSVAQQQPLGVGSAGGKSRSFMKMMRTQKVCAAHTHTHACALSAALTTIVPTTAPGDKDLDQIYRSDGRTKSFFVRSSNTTDVLSSSLGDYDLEPRVCNYLSQPWMATFI